MARTFNADEKVKELIEAAVTIGGETFHPARLTPDVRRDQLAVAIRNTKVARRARLEQDSSDDLTEQQLDDRVDAVAQIDEGVLEQLTILLRDSDGAPPALVFLQEHLDNRVANELLGWLLGEEDEEPGEPTRAPVSTS